MKLSRLLLAIPMTAILSSGVLGQTINIGVNASGKPSIALDGKISKTDTIHLQIATNKELIFDFSNIKDKTARFNLKGAGQNDATEFSVDSNFFVITKTISTDKKLNIVVNEKKINISRPFRIVVGSARFRTSVARTFIPQIGSQNGNTTTTSAAINSMSAPASNIPNDGEPDEEPYHPGSIIYDALKLSDNQNLSEEDFKRIIKFYFPESTIDDVDKAQRAIATNPFLKLVNINPLKPTKETIVEAGGEFLSSLSLSSIGGLDVTNIADGLAKFLVKRTKQELTMAFFQKFKNIIDNNKDLTTLFPQTSFLLSAMGDEVYDFQKYIQNLREAFKEDIRALPKNFPGIIDNHADFFNDNKNLEASLLSACYIANSLENQVHPGDILENYPVSYLDNLNSKNYKGAIQTIQLLSASLRDTSSNDSASYWVSIKKVRDLINNKIALKIYFGLFYQKALKEYDSIKFDNNHSMVSLLENIAPNFDLVYDSYKTYILGFGDKLDGLNKMSKNYSKPANDSLGLEMYAKYFRTTVDMIEYCMNIADLPFADKTRFGKNLGDFHKTLKPYFDITYAVTDMATDINRKNYSAAINHAVYVYNEVMAIKHKKDDAGLVISDNKIDNKKSDKAAGGISTLNNLIKYGGFMASVATAKNSNEVESAIESFALPVGSSRIKRVSDFNVSLNAYVGLFVGYEKIRGVDGSGFKLNTYGITAPIGVSASCGHHILFFKSGHEWSTSLFLSLIDLGAVTAFRVKDTITSQVPTIQLKDIFSPGMFLSLGIPKTPLSINLGAQMGPNLRKVNVTDPGNTNPHNDFENRIYWRYSISVCVDIPVFNFYTKSKE